MASSYLTSTLQGSKLENVSLRIAEVVKRLNAEAIAVRGISGIAVGAVVSAMTGLPLAVARKDEKDGHGMAFEFSIHPLPKKFVIIDDLIATGKTIYAILDKAKEYWPKASCVGIVLYWSGVTLPHWDRTQIPITFVPIDD